MKLKAARTQTRDHVDLFNPCNGQPESAGVSLGTWLILSVLLLVACYTHGSSDLNGGSFTASALLVHCYARPSRDLGHHHPDFQLEMAYWVTYVLPIDLLHMRMVAWTSPLTRTN